MGIVERMLKALLPNADPFQDKVFGKVIAALAKSLSRARAFARAIVDESLPSTADKTLRQWFTMIGLKYDPNQSVERLRGQAVQAYSAAGGSDKAYIERILQKSYPNVSLSEPKFRTTDMVGVGMVGRMEVTDYASWLPSGAEDGDYAWEYYRIVGEVQSTYDRNGLETTLNRIAPAHLTPVFDVKILNATETAEVGLALTGLAQVGRTKED